MMNRLTMIAIAVLSLTARPTTAIAQVLGSVSADGMNVVVGRVVVVDGEASHPVPGALVTLIAYLDDDGRVRGEIPSGYEATFARLTRQEAFTGADGYFVFRGLAAGSYTLGAQAAGFQRPDYRPRVVALGDDGTGASVTLRLVRYAAISGRVFDEAGEPMVGAPVAVLRGLRGGKSPVSQTLTGTVTTDDRGAYRIAELPPGNYLVGVLARSTSLPAALAGDLDSAANGRRDSALYQSLRSGNAHRLRTGEGTRIGGAVLHREGPPPVLAPDGNLLWYATTYYPSALTADAATAIDLRSGETRTGVDVTVTYTRTFRVSGVVTGPAGPIDNLMVRLLPPSSIAPIVAGEIVPEVGAVTSASGAFEFLAVPPGQYRLIAMYVTPREQGRFVTVDGNLWDANLWAVEQVAVEDRDVTGLEVTMAKGFRVSGQVTFENPDDLALEEEFYVALTSFGIGDGLTSQGWSQMSMGPDGAFVVLGIPPGRYWIRPSLNSDCRMRGCTSDETWHWKGTTLDGRPLPYNVIDINGDVSDLEVTVSTRTSGVVGSIVNAEGGPDTSADVIVFPSDTTLWSEDVFSPRVRRVHATSTGLFEFTDLMPGDYYLVAVEGGYHHEGPGALERLVADAETVTVTDGTLVTRTLRSVTLRER
jgi:protocatechuate 3,4-dioxygenase beta subunit